MSGEDLSVDTWKRNGVKILNYENYAVSTRGTRGVLLVYAPWCGACKGYAPEFTKFAKHMAELKDRTKFNFFVAAVNGSDDENSPLRSSLGWKYFPSLYFVDKDGSAVQYKGPRDAQSLADGFADHFPLRR